MNIASFPLLIEYCFYYYCNLLRFLFWTCSSTGINSLATKGKGTAATKEPSLKHCPPRGLVALRSSLPSTICWKVDPLIPFVYLSVSHQDTLKYRKKVVLITRQVSIMWREMCPGTGIYSSGQEKKNMLRNPSVKNVKESISLLLQNNAIRYVCGGEKLVYNWREVEKALKSSVIF